jgi:hypothetical protein
MFGRSIFTRENAMSPFAWEIEDNYLRMNMEWMRQLRGLSRTEVRADAGPESFSIHELDATTHRRCLATSGVRRRKIIPFHVVADVARVLEVPINDLLLHPAQFQRKYSAETVSEYDAGAFEMECNDKQLARAGVAAAQVGTAADCWLSEYLRVLAAVQRYTFRRPQKPSEIVFSDPGPFIRAATQDVNQLTFAGIADSTVCAYYDRLYSGMEDEWNERMNGGAPAIFNIVCNEAFESQLERLDLYVPAYREFTREWPNMRYQWLRYLEDRVTHANYHLLLIPRAELDKFFEQHGRPEWRLYRTLATVGQMLRIRQTRPPELEIDFRLSQALTEPLHEFLVGLKNRAIDLAGGSERNASLRQLRRYLRRFEN